MYHHVIPSGMRAWRPGTKAQQPRASKRDGGFSFFHPQAALGHGTRFRRAVRDSPKGGCRSLVRSANPHGLPPSLGGVGGRFFTCHEGAIMADTLAPIGAHTAHATVEAA